jgi:ABC-type transport system involved in cytochrome c biogenesis permease subunit
MSKLPFGKKNYQWMAIGLVVITIGFIFMAMDKEQHGFGFMGLTLAPIVVLAGFGIEAYAILHSPKEEEKK